MGANLDDILGRTIRLIGNRQGVSLGDAAVNNETAIFNTGDIWFPSGLRRIMIAYVIVTLENVPPGILFDPDIGFELGSPGTADWSGARISLAGQASPVLLYPNIGLTLGTVQPIVVYGQGVAFTATNQNAGTPSSQTATFSCYGWPDN